VTSPPQRHLGRALRYRSQQTLDLPTSCAIPTADESNHSAAGTQYATSTRQCHMRPIRYTALVVLFPSQKKIFAPSLTGDIHAQSSHWNNGKMKNAYNSAYVQTEMFNFTFAQQAIIMYVYLCSHFQEIATGMPNA